MESQLVTNLIQTHTQIFCQKQTMKIAMNKFSTKVLITLGLCIVASCKSNVELKTFSPAYQSLLSPFSAKQIAIFSCEEKADTIIFYPVAEQLIKMRHLERGFYDMYIKSVEYELTAGSFHKFPQSPKAFLVFGSSHFKSSTKFHSSTKRGGENTLSFFF